MKNRHDDTPVINDYTYHVFTEIEKRGLQFAIPDQWRPLYRAFLRERKRKLKVVAAFRSLAASYSQDFGDKGTTTTEANSKANTAAGPLEE